MADSSSATEAAPAPATSSSLDAAAASSTAGAGATGSAPKKLVGAGDTLIPKGSVKRVIKLDKDVRLVGTDAVIAIAKATELFVESFALKAADVTKKRSGEDTSKTIVKYEDVHEARTNDPALEFLDQIIPPPHTVHKTK